MVRWIACALAVATLSGCGKSDAKSLTEAIPPSSLQVTTSTADALGRMAETQAELFEGEVELFGKKLFAKRRVVIDADGNWVKHGLAEAYYPSGQKAGEMWFNNDKPNGKQIAWHDNGRKMLTGESKDGLADGHWTEWYANGQKQSEGDYRLGERHGVWRFWAETGSLAEQIEYRQGQKVRVVQGNGNTLIR